jgi:hypothetical protein
MKNDNLTIRTLLEKFYDAETDEQEEALLKEYFRGDVAPEFEIYKPQFKYYSIGFDDCKSLSDDFDSKFKSNISKSGLKVTKKKSNVLMWYAGVAATLLLAFGLYFNSNTADEFSDNEYAQAVDALILISEKMDVAAGGLQMLGEFDNSFNYFDAFKALEFYGKQINNQ